MFGAIGRAIRVRSQQSPNPAQVAVPQRRVAVIGQGGGTSSAREPAGAGRRWFLSHFCYAAPPAANREENKTLTPIAGNQRFEGQKTSPPEARLRDPNLRGPKGFPRHEDVDKQKKAGMEIPTNRTEAMSLWVRLAGTLPHSLQTESPGTRRGATRHAFNPELVKPVGETELIGETESHGTKRGATRHVFKPHLSADLAQLNWQRETQAGTGLDEDAGSETHVSEECFKTTDGRRKSIPRGSIHVKDPTPFSRIGGKLSR